MFALALISASLVPGSAGARPIRRLGEEIRHVRRRLVKKQKYWKNGYFSAPMEKNGQWILKNEEGIFKSDLGECGTLFPKALIDLCNQFQQRGKNYIPLGCAIKPSKSSSISDDTTKWTKFEERWFILEFVQYGKNLLPIIRYYTPEGLCKDSVVAPTLKLEVGHHNRFAKPYVFERRVDCPYPCLGFKVLPSPKEQSKSTETSMLRLIFRNKDDAESFKLRLNVYSGISDEEAETIRQIKQMGEWIKSMHTAKYVDEPVDAAGSSSAGSPEEKVEEPLDKPQPKKLTAVQMIRAAFRAQEEGKLDHRGVLKALEGNEAFDNYINGSSGSSPRECSKGVAGDCAQDKKKTGKSTDYSSNFKNCGARSKHGHEI